MKEWCFPITIARMLPCLPSRTALTTGQFGIHTGVVGHGGTSADIRIEGRDRGFKSKLEFNTLPGVLSSFGLKPYP